MMMETQKAEGKTGATMSPSFMTLRTDYWIQSKGKSPRDFQILTYHLLPLKKNRANKFYGIKLFSEFWHFFYSSNFEEPKHYTSYNIYDIYNQTIVILFSKLFHKY